jgi:nitrite reductase/ring-hydroxylating ferredoxin subunit
MPALIETAHLDRLPPGKGATLTIGNHTVAVFKVDGVFYGTEAWCLRCGASLAQGCLESRVVACSSCDWRYDITTGSVVGIAALRLRTFAVRDVGGQIIVADV